MFLLWAMSRLRFEGNIDLENAIDQEGTVSLTIPQSRSGIGKVTLSLQGRLKELHAITDGRQLDKNTAVIVLDLSGGQLVVAALKV